MGKVRDFDTYYFCDKEYCKQFGYLLIPQEYVVVIEHNGNQVEVKIGS